jgi:hypothetical protein
MKTCAQIIMILGFCSMLYDAEVHNGEIRGRYSIGWALRTIAFNVFVLWLGGFWE